MKRIGISLFRSRTVSANAKPSTSGIMMSEMIRSKIVPPYIASKASWALRHPVAL